MDIGSTDRDKWENTRNHPVGGRMTVDEPAKFGQRTEPTEEDPDIETKQDPEPDSHKEPDEELVLENQGRRYSLRERRIP